MTLLGFFSFALLVLGIICAVISMAVWQARTGVPPQPSTRAERRAVIELLRDAGVKDGVIYELGCGWGGLARKLARSFPLARIEAVELSPVPARWAQLRASRIANLSVTCRDIFETPFSDAAAVVCYLITEGNERLIDRLDGQLAPGTPVVTVVFRFRGRDVDREIVWRGWQSGQVIRYRWQAE